MNPKRTGAKPDGRFQILMVMLGCGGMFAENTGRAQTRESLAGESAARALEKAIEAEPYDLKWGPVRGNLGARLGVSYTDNVFYSETRKYDVMIEPEVTLGALLPVSKLNELRLSLAVSYEWYLNNSILNANTPFIHPGSGLSFNLFVGDFHIRLHDNFSYEESLFVNSFGGNEPYFNFNNVGKFARFDNKAGLDVTWDLNKAVITAGYDHETFLSPTSQFEYLNRESEWFTASAGYYLGDHLQTGVEDQFSFHSYDRETVLNDHWHNRVGPFVEATLLEGVTLRAGAGSDVARYDTAAGGTSDYDTYYAYGRISQKTRLFTHSVEAGREHLLGDNANNLRTHYLRYVISWPIMAHVDLRANAGVNAAEESGGPSGFDERFTYYNFGFQAGWQFRKHWRAEAGYQYLLKNSELADRDFQRNRLTADVVWEF
ncbi:MAG TPA: hypothetical protein VH598_02685 [Verrucomicrobiae bacterium]|nr:hypothetical protein [Verrucomicrobiae bacterium]